MAYNALPLRCCTSCYRIKLVVITALKCAPQYLTSDYTTLVLDFTFWLDSACNKDG